MEDEHRKNEKGRVHTVDLTVSNLTKTSILFLRLHGHTNGSAASDKMEEKKKILIALKIRNMKNKP